MGDVVKVDFGAKARLAQSEKALAEGYEILFRHFAPNKLPIAPLLAADVMKCLTELYQASSLSVTVSVPGATPRELEVSRAAIQEAVNQASDLLEAHRLLAATNLSKAVLRAVRRCVET